MIRALTDRRTVFFFLAAIVSVLMVPVAPADFRNVCWIVAAVYVVLSAAMALDTWSRNRKLRR
jgi:hypothetical protein